MTSATEELRRLLDERGVEWEDCGHGSTYVEHKGEAWRFDYDETFNQLVIVWLSGYKPAQAVAATLGRDNAERYVGLRQGKYWERTENSDYYCGGCGWKVTDHDSYCPECGGALHKAALDSSNCANSERTDAPSLPHFWTHDGTLHIELPKLPESISVRLPDQRDREVHSARVWQYTRGNDGVGRTNDGLADLQAENAKLREQVDAAHMSRLLTENENESLRELVADMYEMAYPECPSAFEAAFANRMRELGVEVE